MPDLTSRRLFTATSAYLALPILIFLGGWLKLWLALPIGGLVIVGLLSVVRQFRPGSEMVPVRWKTVAFALLAAGLLLSLSGVGGLGPQRFDWVKHNIILHELVTQPWPVIFEGELALVYYIAYYLPAALVGKTLGWLAANLALALWTWFGLGLAISWFVQLTHNKWLSVLIFLIFSGLDVIGFVLMEVLLPVLAVPETFQLFPLFELDVWALAWQLISNIALLTWVPQHALAGWLLSLLFLAWYQTPQRSASSPFVLLLALSLLWSPLVTIGLLPFFYFEARAFKLDQFTNVSTVGGIILALIVVLYFQTKLELGPEWPSIPIEPRLQGLTPGLLAVGLGLLTVFFVLEYLIFVPIFFKGLDHSSRQFFILVSIFLFGLLFLRVGLVNDLQMRASIPGLLVLAVFFWRAAGELGQRKLKKVYIWVLICLGSLTGLTELSWHWLILARPQTRYFSVEIPFTQTLWDIGDPGLLAQYIGSSSNLFFDVLARSIP
jgi:hypothetical protein